MDVWMLRTSIAASLLPAEYRLAESFGELTNDSIPKKGPEEDVQENMKSYL